MKYCPKCEQSWDSSFQFCPSDATPLLAEDLRVAPETHGNIERLGGKPPSIPDSETAHQMVEASDRDSENIPRDEGLQEMAKLAAQMRSRTPKDKSPEREPDAFPASLSDEALARRSNQRWVVWVVLAAGGALLLFFLSGSGEEEIGASPEIIEEPEIVEQLNVALPVSLSYEVLKRPGEGDPGHHPHTVVRLNGYNLFVVRNEDTFPSAVERAQDVVAKLLAIHQETTTGERAGFSVLPAGVDFALMQEGRDTPILTITRPDVVAYNQRSSHTTTGQELAMWYRDRLQAFWDVFVYGEPPRVKSEFDEVILLDTIARRAQGIAQREDLPLNQAVQRALSGLSFQESSRLQETVFTVPEDAESSHEESHPQ